MLPPMREPTEGGGMSRVGGRVCGLVSWFAFRSPPSHRAPFRVVKDPSGAVLPGVTIEVTSPVLIEKTRSVVTDEQGRYSNVVLVPNEGYRPALGQPLTILQGRIFRATLQVKF